jgi:hypothetical protein
MNDFLHQIWHAFSSKEPCLTLCQSYWRTRGEGNVYNSSSMQIARALQRQQGSVEEGLMLEGVTMLLVQTAIAEEELSKVNFTKL